MGHAGGKNKARSKVGTRRNKNVNSVNALPSMEKVFCFYTNADQFRNKFTEFQVRIRDTKPTIIGITEVKAKNSKFLINPAEFTMDWSNEYDMFCMNIDNDIGRGLLLYTHKSLGATEVRMDTGFQENLFVKVHTNHKETLLVGLLYRSESGTEENNNKLR